jgi:hypothetical protein
MSWNTHDRDTDHHGTDLTTNMLTTADIATAPSGSTVQAALEALDTATGGSGQIKVSSVDSTSAWVDTKLVAGPGIALTVLSPGGDETLQIASSGSGGTLSLGGIAGEPHVGTGGAIGSLPQAAESDHQHPAQVILTGAVDGDMVASIQHNSLAYPQIQVGLEPGTGLSVIRFRSASAIGAQIRGPTPGSTGTDRGLVSIEGIGGVPATVILDASGTILRGGTDEVLYASDLGVTVQPYAPALTESVGIISDVPFTSGTIAGVTGLSIGVISGTQYSFKARVIFQTAATTTGIKLGLICPTMAYIGWEARIPTSISAFDYGAFHTTTQVLTTAGIDAANTTYLATLEGVFEPSASGNFQIGAATEVGGSTVTVKAGSILTIDHLP